MARTSHSGAFMKYIPVFHPSGQLSLIKFVPYKFVVTFSPGFKSAGSGFEQP
jgi:hypothetical protein